MRAPNLTCRRGGRGSPEAALCTASGPGQVRGFFRFAANLALRKGARVQCSRDYVCFMQFGGGRGPLVNREWAESLHWEVPVAQSRGATAARKSHDRKPLWTMLHKTRSSYSRNGSLRAPLLARNALLHARQLGHGPPSLNRPSTTTAQPSAQNAVSHNYSRYQPFAKALGLVADDAVDIARRIRAHCMQAFVVRVAHALSTSAHCLLPRCLDG